MFRTSELADHVNDITFVLRGKKLTFTDNIQLQIGDLWNKSYARCSFSLSHYDEGKTIRVLSIEPSDGDLNSIDLFDNALQRVVDTEFPDNTVEWRSAVVQEGEHRPRIQIKINCMKDPRKATQIFTWDGVSYSDDDGKPSLKAGTLSDLNAGVEIVSQLNVSNVWSFRGKRGFTLYANSICVIVKAREVTFR